MMNGVSLRCFNGSKNCIPSLVYSTLKPKKNC